MPEWCLVNIKVSHSKRYYDCFKKSVFIKIHRSGHIGWVIEQVSPSIYFMDLQIKDIENGRWCIWNSTCERKFRIDLVKKLGYPPFEEQNNPIFTCDMFFMHLQEKINILLSVSSDYFLLYFDICLNVQRFVQSDFCKYRLGLRSNKHIFTKCNSCLPAIQWFYIQHCPRVTPMSKLDVFG